MNLNLALSNTKLFALIVLVLLTAFIVTSVLLSMVAHIDVWHTLMTLVPLVTTRQY